MKRFIYRILSLANYDFCPNYNRYVYWLKDPIGWVISSIAFSLLIGIFVAVQGFILAFAFTSLLVMGLVWPWLSMKGINSEIIFPEGKLWEGETFEAVFRVQNFWPLPVFGLMIKGDFLQALGLDEEPVAFSLKRVPAWSQSEFRVPITPRRRGCLPSGEANLVNGFPFGLVDISKPLRVPQSALVWPACHRLEGQPEARGTSYSVLGSLCDRSGNDGDTIGVRPYQQGDRLRNIHWAQTVRAQNLMVRERQTLTSTAATVVLDLTPGTHAGHGVQNSFEWAIRIAASVCWQLHQARSNVQLVLLGIAAIEQNTFGNGSGIHTIINALAELPTLDDAHRQTEPGPSGYHFHGGGRHLFFIGTNLSKSFHQLDDDVKSIMLDVKGFASHDDQNWDKTIVVSDDMPQLVITAPQKAAAQLEAEWNRSFCHAAG